VEGRPPDEQELIERSCNGDTDAYGALVRTHQKAALRVAFLVVRDRAEAEDVTQEALVNAYNALGRFRAGSPFRPWLLRIVRNEALNRVRGRKRREFYARQLFAESVPGGAAPSPETILVADSSRNAVLAAMERLPEKYRAVLYHRYLIDLSEAEVARVLGIPRGTVKSRASRGLTRLRTLLEAEGWDRQ
jgi:RNA polymerase sigma factor (sigma-70 family)